MRQEDKEKKWGYDAAIGIGILIGGITGVFGGALYEGFGAALGGMDHYGFIGACSSLVVALIFNSAIRKYKNTSINFVRATMLAIECPSP